MTCRCADNYLHSPTDLMCRLRVLLDPIFPTPIAKMIATYHIFYTEYHICTRSCDATILLTYYKSIKSKGNPAYGANIPAYVVRFLNNRTPKMQIYATYGAFLAVEPTTNNIIAWGKDTFGGVVPDYVYIQLARSKTRILNCSSTHSQFTIHIEIGDKRTHLSISWPQLGTRTGDNFLI